MLLVTGLWGRGVQAQTAYHFSPFGDDAAGDGSLAHPWASIERANALDLGPGDSLLFEGGQTFAGRLYLDADDAGTPARPVVVSSYGEGRAVIEAGGGGGIFVHNAGGLEVTRLRVVGDGAATNTASGISFYVDLGSDVKLEHLRVDDVEVSGFGRSGLSVGAWNGRSGYADVRLTNVTAHGNRDGIQVFGEAKGAHRDVYVGHCRSYDNPGDAASSNPTGSGIVFGQVDGGVIERSLTYGNGAASQGAIGIWTYEANDVLIQYNESYANKTTTGTDGGGFDLDGGTTNSVLQYNYSHDNDGAGYGLYQYGGASPFGGNTVRYNISENDGRKNGYGGISVWGASPSDVVADTDVYNNTVFVSPTSTGSPAAVEFKNGNAEGLTFRNNVLVTTGGVRLLKGPASAAVAFQGNAFWPSGSPFRISWGGTTYASLDDWRQATGQEQHEGAPLGLSVDPRLVNPGGGGIIDDPERLASLEAYRLLPGSPLIDAALDLHDVFGLDPGPADFYGTSLDAEGAYTLGAYEVRDEAANLVGNPGFEVDGGAVQEPSGWTTWSPGSAYDEADFTEGDGGAAGGNYHATHWSANAYEVATSQELEVADGVYTAAAWVRSSGGQNAARFEVSGYGGDPLSVAVPASEVWTRLEIPHVPVTAGRITIGFYSESEGGYWLHFDEVWLEWESEGAEGGDEGGGGVNTEDAPGDGGVAPGLGNYPNPFDAATTVQYTLAEATTVHVELFDALGRRVAVLDEGVRAPGRHEVALDGSALMAGVYFCRLRAGALTLTRRMLVVK